MIPSNMSEEIQTKLDKKRKTLKGRLKRLGSSGKSFLTGIGIFLLVTFVCFIPTWIFLGMRMAVGPYGFWENLAILGIGLWALGGFQTIGLILWFYFVIWVLLELLS